MKADAVLAPVSWQRMIAAVEKVRARMLRAVRALEEANVPYAIVGGNAVAAWVSRLDEAAVRNTRDVGILLRRSDLKTARKALEAADRFRLVALDALVRMKLAAFRDKDRTHLRDLTEVGLLDISMLERLPAELRPRLQLILDTPEG